MGTVDPGSLHCPEHLLYYPLISMSGLPRTEVFASQGKYSEDVGELQRNEGEVRFSRLPLATTVKTALL